MYESSLVNPDARFIRDVMSSGGEDLKKCMQCGTCSAVCTLSSEDSSFPRKQIFEAQWGLGEKLAGDPAIWLCHNCGDCTDYCPRGARPGDVFGALRQKAIEHFAFPGFMGKMAGSPKALALLLVIPALVFGLIALQAPAAGETPSPEFAAMFPIPVLEALFFALSALVVGIFATGLVRFLRALEANGGGPIGPAGLIAAFKEIATHERFAQCGRNDRRVGHLLLFWGFMGLAFMGTAVGIGTMAGVMRTPLALSSPWKIFGNIAAAVALAGCLILLVQRISDPVKREASTYFDWFFLLALTGVVLTGISSELLRLSQAGRVMYGVYFVHLVLIFSLFLYAPYSKFAHFLYRTVAIASTKVEAKGRIM